MQMPDNVTDVDDGQYEMAAGVANISNISIVNQT